MMPRRTFDGSNGAAELETAAFSGLLQSWTGFWFSPVAPTALHVVRVLSGLLFLFWLLSLAGHQTALFGLGGWLDAQAHKEVGRMDREAAPEQMLDRPDAPMNWSVLYLCGDSSAAVQAVYWASVAVLVLFTLGAACRLTALLTWLIVASFTSNPAMYEPADQLLTMLAFYLMLGYLLLGQYRRSQSWAGRVLGPRDAFLFPWRSGSRKPDQDLRGSYAAHLALRLFQVHFALLVFTSGLQKLQFAEWWSGVALWFPLHPPLETSEEELRTIASQAPRYLFFLSLAGYCVLAWQLLFPMFAWRKHGWRLVLLGGAVAGCVGGALIGDMSWSGPTFVVASLCYVAPTEWRQLARRLAGLSGLLDLTGQPASPVRLAAGSRG